MNKLLTSDYWFGPTLPGFHFTDKFILGFSLLLVAAGLIVWVIIFISKNKFQRKLLRRVRNLLVTIGLLGVFWALMRYELVQFFSMRFIAALIFLAGLWWAYEIFRFWRSDYLSEKEKNDRDSLKNKYL